MIRMTLEKNNECLGFIDIELDEKNAPISAKNFLELVQKGFYDGVVFHRIIRDFMVQAGGYYFNNNKLMMKNEAKTIKGEFKSNGIDNPIKHKRGVISMARTNVKDSASAQFFICTVDCPHLDGEYAAFGHIVNEESFNVLDKLNNTRIQFENNYLSDFPYPVITIKKMEVL